MDGCIIKRGKKKKKRGKRDGSREWRALSLLRTGKERVLFA